MDRLTRRVFLGLLVVLVAVGIALVALGQTGTPTRPDAPTVDGVVVKVTSTGLVAVSGFTLRTDDGRTLEFGLANLRDGTTFPPGHLGEHQATAQRIRVWYSQSPSGGLDALWLEDAPAD